MVTIFVDPVAKAHQFAFLFEGPLHPSINIKGTVFGVRHDFIQHVHGGFIGTTMEIALEGANCGAHRGVQVRIG